VPIGAAIEIALDKIATTRGKIVAPAKHTTTRPDYTASANDNTIIEGITGSPTSLGWVGFAYAEENKDKVAEIQVAKDPNGTCVAPSVPSVTVRLLCIALRAVCAPAATSVAKIQSTARS